jgi:hypothetical protein
MSSATAVVVLAVGMLAPSVGAQDAMPVLRLSWFDPSGLGRQVDFDARAETAQLLGAMGVAVSWRIASPGELLQRDELWVVLVGAGPKGPRRTEVLGATRTNAPASRVVWIRVPNVRAAIGASEDGAADAPPDEHRRVGRAIGRVIAHEVIHVLVPTLPHGAGLMAEVLTRRQLTDAPVLIAPGIARSVRLAVIGRTPPVAQRTAVLYALGGRHASR